MLILIKIRPPQMYDIFAIFSNNNYFYHIDMLDIYFQNIDDARMMLKCGDVNIKNEVIDY